MGVEHSDRGPCPYCGSEDWNVLPNHLRHHCPVLKRARERDAFANRIDSP